MNIQKPIRTLDEICEGTHSYGVEHEPTMYCNLGKGGRKIECTYAQFIGEEVPICKYFEMNTDPSIKKLISKYE
ncbi:MAG: hypothetical protein LAT82_02965 [Nanoarchaeota archaeon]|nr:hypothetical protein [Nanoarchaeota archaeon]